MDIIERMEGDVVILSLEGKFVGGTECTAIYTRAKELIEQGIRKAVVDLHQVTLLNSSGLGALVGSLISFRRVGGDLKLARLKDRMHGLLMAADVIRLFETFDTVEDAVKSYAA
jgi:anti-sigma B factor antagonist